MCTGVVQRHDPGMSGIMPRSSCPTVSLVNATSALWWDNWRNHVKEPCGTTVRCCVEDVKEALTVCPWNVLMGRSCPSLQTWIHMSVLQEANVLLLCQSTSRAGAEGSRNTINTSSHILTGSKLQRTTTLLCTWMEGELLFGFSRVSVPYDGCLVRH